MSKDFRRKLKKELQTDIAPVDAHLGRTIRLAHAAYTGRRKLRYISTFEMITSQFRFIARPVWILQGIALLCLCAFMGVAMISEQFVNKFPAFASVSAVFVSMTVLPIYGRSRRHRMREIESTTRISHPRLILAKLCVVGIGDAVCLAAITLLTFEKMTAPAQTVLTFILLPFLITCTASLFIMNRVKEEYGISVSTGLCIGIGVVCWTMATKPQPLLTQISIGLSAAVCAFLIFALAFECRRMMRQIPSSDLQEALIF